VAGYSGFRALCALTAYQRRSKLVPLNTRLAVLAAVGLAVLPVLSACGGTATPTAPAGGSGAGSEGVAALEAEGLKGNPSASGKLEFFSWWTAGGEADGKNDILNLYKQLFPNVEIVDAAVAGGGGDQAKAVLKTRMQGNDPPDTFQVHGGPELLAGFVDAGRMDSIKDVWDELKLGDALPKQLQDMVSKDGTPYAVPANVHRGNVLFYNKKVFTDNNLKAPTTWDEFMTTADTLKGKGITPLGVGGKDTWAVTMLFEDLLLANGGADKFNSLMKGETQWTDEAVVKSLTMLGDMVKKGYFGDNYSGLTWDAASGEVLNGKAGMTIMGDWAKGYFQANDPKWAENFGWAPSPGTTGIFKVITDSFGLPKGAKNADNTKNFLRVLGSKTGQVTFNLRKGSIPARTDTDTSKFDVYMKDAAKDFSEAKSLVGSAPHGSATIEAFASQLNTAINTFASNPADAAAAAQGIQQQASDLLK
jgi:glucose/mannose transport system substrate-binding protein